MGVVSWCLVKNMAVGCRLSQRSAGWYARCLHPPCSHRSLITGQGWQAGQGNSPASSHSGTVPASSLCLRLFFMFVSTFPSFFSLSAEPVTFLPFFPFIYYQGVPSRFPDCLEGDTGTCQSQTTECKCTSLLRH